MLSLHEIHKSFQPSRPLGRELAALFGFGKKDGANAVLAVRGVSLELKPGEVLGLVGESGSGKSTLGRVMAGLYRPEQGRVEWRGRDLAGLSAGELKNFRRRAQIMFQDPVSSLNPRMSAGAALEEALIIHRLGDKAARRRRVVALLDEVGLPVEALGRYPHQFSGGQRQRLSLARALSLDPEILIADEPVSALDVSIQAQIINLLLNLKDGRGLTLVMISHDLPLVRLVSDRIAVMYGGMLMELAGRAEVGRVRHHPYVDSLWASAAGGDNPHILKGEPPDPQNPPPGCPFHPRCPAAVEICGVEMPAMRPRGGDHFCACHRV